ncbi:dihydrolipoamide acetyltransferase family protein [Nocardia goodfellowii]|uniref:Dihydrolipoamide acetyltransferase component of pyruvate dehydrogenase complex n=1 Tax=Nocardia goodfellowii TaxID=882446 RepID=A0ABS4Q638_9NOCA|nr:dihydrolipoamide acetyltransferase family protein [Nocardia goodfellowii]MBP2187152.1 pyruvate dehydrogenase E2 component (dihydrolipoamide acetyltransferase) [Nocardia goodfellowii]
MPEDHVLEFRLPDLGEGLTDAELQSWAVAVGDTVQLNQTIAEVETAKAVVALPSPFAGVVVELLAEPGDTVEVGAPLIRVRGDQEAPAEGGASGRTSVLVGYGPEAEAVSRRRKRAPAEDSVEVTASESVSAPDAQTADEQPIYGKWSADSEVSDQAAPGPAVPERDSGRTNSLSARAAATPAARKLARELGIDLWYVAGSGPDGAVTVEDVRSAVPVTQPRKPPGHNGSGDATAADARTGGRQHGGLIRPPDREERTPVSGVRKRIAAAMVASARTIPQASTFVTIDCTASMELLDHLRTTKAFTGLTLTPLTLVAKAVLVAITDFPAINAAWDEANQQIITKHYVNLGIAVATDRGLLVPNLKDADSASLRDLAKELAWLADTARSGNATPVDLRGGTFTISNVGVFGVDAGVPLVNPGEAAILCLGAIAKRPWVFRDELAVRWVTTLGLSFDHRMVDGELGARFLATVASLLEDPLTLLSRS